MAFDTELDEIMRIDLFAVFEPEALRALIYGAETRLLRAGDVLFRCGETADGVIRSPPARSPSRAANPARQRRKSCARSPFWATPRWSRRPRGP